MRFFLNEIGQYFKDSYIPLFRFHGKSIILVSIIRVNCSCKLVNHSYLKMY